MYDTKTKIIEDKISNITNSATETTLIGKLIGVKGEIPNIINLSNKIALNSDDNKIPSVSDLVKKNDYNTKITDHNHDKHIATLEFRKRTPENYAVRLKQANLVIKTEFDNKLTSFHKRITSNKTNHL